jgi:hypothetical protein
MAGAEAEIAWEFLDKPAAPAVLPASAATAPSPPVFEERPAPVSIELPPPKEEAAQPRPLRAWAVPAAAVGVIGATVFAVFGSKTQSIHKELANACPFGACTPEHQSDIEAGRRDQIIANVGLGIGIAGLGTALVLWLAPGRGPSQSARRVTPWIGANSGGLSGRF